MKHDAISLQDDIPLCVDLDGTLARTDTLHEGLLRAFKKAPSETLKALPLALRSKAGFKRRIAEIAPIVAETLPLNYDLMEYIDQQRVLGRRVDLVSAADQSVVDSVAVRLGIFDRAIGSDGIINLSGAKKLAVIRSLHGADFAYAGDSWSDLVVWRAAKGAVVVGSEGFARGAAGGAKLEAVFPRSTIPWRAAWRVMRPHQWAKNLLILVPLVLAWHEAAGGEIIASLLGFLAFSLIASAGYVFNDLMDLDADRAHPIKRLRPLASGELTAAEGLLLFAGLLGVGGGIAVALVPTFAAVCALYFCGTMLYSFWLKRRPLVDIMALAALYTIRIVAGTVLAAGIFSFWLFTFSMFIFASLAILKRYTELADEGIDAIVRKSRGYTAIDLPLLLPFGAGCAVSASLLFVIYLVEERFPSTVYTRPEALWLIFPVVLLWQMHMWRAAVHGRIHEDPVLFAVKDRVSQMMGGLSVLFLVLAW